MKRIIYVLLFFAFATSASAQINLTSNQTLSYNYNGTGNETFYCALPEMETYTIGLSPGQNKNFTSNFTKIISSCSAETTNTTVCVIDEEIRPGETYRERSGACDVRIEVRDEDDDDTDVDVVTKDIEVTYEFLDERFLRLTIGNRTNDIDLTNDALEFGKYRYPLEVLNTCSPSDLADDKDIQRTCMEVYEELQLAYLNTSLSCTKNAIEVIPTLRDTYINSLESKDDAFEFETKYVSLVAEHNATQRLLATCNQQQFKEEEQYQSLREQRNAWIVAFFFILVIFGYYNREDIMEVAGL